MDIIGVIRPKPNGGLGMTFDAWCNIVRTHAALVRPAPRHAKNPRTGEWITIYPSPDGAMVVVDGQEVGDMYWSMSGETEIWVSGVAPAVVPIAHEIAAMLGAEFQATDADG